MTIRLDAHGPAFHRAAPPQLPVLCATTGNITISTALNAGDTIDGVTLAAGNRVLVWQQSTGSQNGVYIVGATPVRADDMAEGVAAWGAVIYVIAGTTYGGVQFHNTNATLPTIDTTALTFAAFTSSGLSDPMTTRGDIIIRNSANVTARLGRGSANTVFRSDGTDVTWGKVVEADFNFTDVTTADSSTSQHGLLKKLPGGTSTFLRADGSFATPTGTGAAIVMDPIYGDGHDGDATISVDTTISKDMHYNNLTVNVGINLDTALLRVFVKGTLTLNGTIRCNGNNGGNGGNGTAGAGGAAGAAGTQQTGGANQNLPNGTVGIAGAVGGINANGSGTTAGSSTTYGFPNVPAGTAGGVSGSGRSGGAGGAAGTATDTIQAHPYVWPAIISFRRLDGTAINLSVVNGTAAQAGSGGGAAASGGGGSGGGGSGGGVVVVCAKTITGNGTIQAKGGNGGNGGNGLAGAQAGGGAAGNGGQGGIVVLIYKDGSGWSGTLDVAGGTKGTKGTAGGGAGSTDGGTGNDGGAGKSFSMQFG